MGDLTGMMNHVTRNDRLLPTGSDVHADVPGRVSRCRFQPYFIGNAMIRRHQQRQRTEVTLMWDDVRDGPVGSTTVHDKLPIL